MELPVQQLAEVFARTVQPDRVNGNSKVYKDAEIAVPTHAADGFPATTGRR